MEIDLDRWQALRAAYADSVDVTPSFALLQTAQQTWAKASSDLQDFQARGAVGRRDARNPDLETAHKRSVDELTQRVIAADAEVRRISALQGKASARRNALRALIDGVKAWARQQSPPIALAGDDEISMRGFSASSVHIATPAEGREFAPLQR